MSKPDDIPADIWDAADTLATRVRDAYLDDDDLVLGRPREIAARALMAERVALPPEAEMIARMDETYRAASAGRAEYAGLDGMALVYRLVAAIRKGAQ